VEHGRPGLLNPRLFVDKHVSDYLFQLGIYGFAVLWSGARQMGLLLWLFRFEIWGSSVGNLHPFPLGFV
jgi:hypothetical protein